MNRRAFLQCAAAAPMLAGCGILTPSYAVRFRLSLSATVDGVARTGSTVIEKRWVNSGPLSGLSSWGRWAGRFTGNALTLDLGRHGLLFGLMGSVTNAPSGFIAPDGLLFALLPGPLATAKEHASGRIFDSLANLRGEFDLKPSDWPALVRLRDMNDIKSAEIVDPAKFAAFYGEGAALNRVSIAVTQDPVTSGIENRLPCWDQIGTFPDDPKRPVFTRPLYENLHTRNFRLDWLTSTVS